MNAFTGNYEAKTMVEPARCIAMEMPRPFESRIYTFHTKTSVEKKAKNGLSKTLSVAAMLALVFAVPLMLVDFALGSVVGIPAFAFLLAAAQDHKR